jgi:hypothetical protein
MDVITSQHAGSARPRRRPAHVLTLLPTGNGSSSASFVAAGIAATGAIAVPLPIAVSLRGTRSR